MPAAQAKSVPVIPAFQFPAAPSITLETRLPKNLSGRVDIVLEQQFVAEIQRGRVVGSAPAIISSDDTIIGELSMMFAPYYHDLFFVRKLPAVVQVEGPVLVLAGAPG